MKHPPIPGPIPCHAVNLPSGLTAHYTGPDLTEGLAPTFLYFALAGDESLNLDPYNQVVAFLSGSPIRSWSMTIPGHGPGFDKTQAVYYFADQVSKGVDLFNPFFDQVQELISYGIEQGLMEEGNIVIGGLSRGGFVGSLIAARDPRISHVLAFAPVTSLKVLQAFHEMREHPIVQSLDLHSKIPQLIGRPLRYYIGNRDQRVSTDVCFDFVRKLTNASFEAGVRTPPVELIVGPSIGHMGHGTPPHVFHSGADWVREALLS